MDTQELIQDLIELVKQASPFLWKLAQQQVWAETVATAIWLVILLILLFGMGYIFIRLCLETYRGNIDGFGPVFSGIFFFALLVAVAAISGELVGYLLAPDYHALKILLGLMK